MKTSFKLFAISLFTLLSVITTTTVSKSQVSASVSFSVFHDNLQAYGRWVSHPRYGQVWTPRVSGFRPYSTGGHWAYTDYGWTWVSDYDWGWAPFHYGRWAYDPLYGWVWIPGYEWGPAWVSWRTGGDYYGWAPLGPDVSIGIGVSFGTTIPADYWVFTPRRYITSPVVYRYYAPRTRNVTIIRNTTIINNTRETNVFNSRAVVVGGPRREDVERVAHTRVQVMHVNDASRPTRETVDRSKNTVNIYRPVVNKTTVNKNVTVNKTTVNKTEANKTTVNKNKNVTTNNKEVQKNAPQNKNPNPQNTRKQTEKKQPAENKRPIEKKPAQKPNNERPASKPNNDNDNNKPKKPQASVNLSSKDEHSNAGTLNKAQVKREKSKIETRKRDTSNNVAKSNHRKPKPNEHEK